MKIKDPKEKYVLKIDLSRNVVYETPTSYWKHEDFKRLHNEYVRTIVPLFNGKPWRKCCDLRTYQISMHTEEIQDHVLWGSKNGYVGAAIISDPLTPGMSAIELQMKLCIKNIDFDLMIFKSIEEADAWLDSQLI